MIVRESQHTNLIFVQRKKQNSRKTPCFGVCLFVDFKQLLHLALALDIAL